MPTSTKSPVLSTKYSELSTLKVAIVCDWLTGYGGAERVVLELHRMFPDAPIYTSQYDSKLLDWFRDADVHTLWLQKLPRALKKFLPVLRARAFSRLDLSDYDLVISSTGAEAKAVKTGSNTIHVCYCNAPTHYYWSRYEDYLKNPGFPIGFNWLAKLALRILVGPLRRWDYKAAQKPNYLLANSTHTKAQIKKYYDRDSEVVFPPVDIERFKTQNSELRTQNLRHGFVVAGRQTPYKRVDLAVAACTQLGLPLIVIGKGPEHEKLKKMSGSTITFIDNASDEDVASYFAGAEAFIFPGVDDFGITPVEAMAAGTPVIAFKDGGALDYVVESKTGKFFEEQTVESLAQCLQSFKPADYSHDDIKAAVQKFSLENFQKNLQTQLDRVLQ